MPHHQNEEDRAIGLCLRCQLPLQPILPNRSQGGPNFLMGQGMFPGQYTKEF